MAEERDWPDKQMALLFFELTARWRHGNPLDDHERRNLEMATDIAMRWLHDGKLPSDGQLENLSPNTLRTG